MTTSLTDQVVVTSVGSAPDAVAWAAEHRAELWDLLDRDGVVLLRGLSWDEPGAVAGVVRAIGSSPVPEREGFAPRAALPGDVYGGCEWPADQPMCLHHEMSYRTAVPSLMALGCRTAPDSGGATPVADARAVLADLPDAVVARFRATGWTLNRAYGDDLGVSPADAFGTGDPDGVAAYCAAHDVEAVTGPDGVLRTRQTRPAEIVHPRSGEALWANQIGFLNAWTMDPLVREYLLAAYGPDGLPFDTTYGDGEPLDRETVETIDEVYRRHARREPWRAGDLMLVDNVRTAHGRDPYTGSREVVVCFADPVPHGGRG